MKIMILQLQNTFKSAANILAILLISYTQINLPLLMLNRKGKLKGPKPSSCTKEFSLQPEICGENKNWDESTINSIISRKWRGLNPDLNVQKVKLAQLE
jgi:hypothetical protein